MNFSSISVGLVFAIAVGVLPAAADSPPSIEPVEAAERVEKKQAVLVDVREPEEWESGVVAFAHTLSLSDLRGDRDQWNDFLAEHEEEEILLYCRTGNRSGIAAGILADEGFRVRNAGGFSEWQAAGLPERKPSEPRALAGAETEPKTIELFDGKTLDGWVQRGGDAKYSVEDGCIVGRTVLDTPNSFLCTEEDFSDFILELEYKVDPKLNSGVQIRSQHFDHPTKAKDSEGNPVLKSNGDPISLPAGRVHGYQVEIDPSPRSYSGAIYDEGRRGWLKHLGDNKAAREASKLEEWNELRIEARGDLIKTWINGVPAVEVRDDVTPKGFIGLQVHGVGSDEAKEGIEVRWRNIRLTELEEE